MTNAEARFNKSLRPRKPEGSLGRTAQDVHLESHTAPELCSFCIRRFFYNLNAHVVYAIRNKTKFVWIGTELFLSLSLSLSLSLTRGGHASCLCACFDAMLLPVLLVPKHFGVRWQGRWTAARRWRVPLQWCNHFWQSLEEGAGNVARSVARILLESCDSLILVFLNTVS